MGDHQSLTLVTLAGGIGRRYGGLKQMDPVGPNGQVLMDYNAFAAAIAGFRTVVFLSNNELIRDFQERYGRDGTIITTSDGEHTLEVRHAVQETAAEINKSEPWNHVDPCLKRTKPFGTGHALYCVRNVVDGPFVSINADDFYGAGTFQILADFFNDIDTYRQGIAVHAMPGYRMENVLSGQGTVCRGLCQVDRGGFLESIVETLDIGINPNGQLIGYQGQRDDRQEVTLNPKDIASMNIWAMTHPKEVFNMLCGYVSEFEGIVEKMAVSGDENAKKLECFLPDFIFSLIKNGNAKVKVLNTPERWFGMTYQEEREHAKREIARLTHEGVFPEKLWGG